MDQKRKRRSRKQKKTSTCQISTYAHALSYSSPLIHQNFYKWANQKWLRETPIPFFENDFGAGEEVERCIFEQSFKLLMNIKESDSQDPNDVFLRTLANSCLHSRAQQNSVDFLQRTIHTLECVNTKEDVVREFANLAKIGFPSLFYFRYHVEKNKNFLVLDANTSSLPNSFYNDPKKMASYKSLLHKIGPLLHVDNLERVIPMEHGFVNMIDEVWSEEYHKTKGSTFAKKFPGIPWNIYFDTHGITNWKSMTFFYRAPRWIRFISQMLKEVSIDFWKLFLARAYIIPSLPYLPPPFDEEHFAFFGQQAQGQVKKTPQQELFVRIVYNFCIDLFSKMFWEKYGDNSFEKEIRDFVQTIVEATCSRIEKTEWLQSATRKKAIEKVKGMGLEVVRPREWTPFTPIPLDDKNLLLNIFNLGEMNVTNTISLIGKTHRYWDEGIYRVNAYYYSENNQIVIPYGTVYSPFYDRQKSLAYNLGGLGAIIGHEICHAFDNDGKNYDVHGQKKKWWSRKDNLRYNQKTKALIHVFNSQTVDGKHLNGKNTLGENIADLGGLAIALEALQKTFSEDTDTQEAYRDFFISYAISWRTKYRKQKVQRMIESDVHVPAEFRVNCIVSQFDEFYEAFNIAEKPKEQIRIF
jgi:putative endopeptidase